MANGKLFGLFGRRTEPETPQQQAQPPQMTELERIDKKIADMEAAIAEQSESGKMPWEYDLSSATTAYTKKREQQEADEMQAKLDAQATEPVLPGMPDVKQSQQLPTPEGMKSQVDITYKTPIQKQEYVEGQPFDWETYYNVKKGKKDNIPTHLKGSYLKRSTDKDTGVRTEEKFLPRYNDRGQEVRILKEDDWIKQQPWAIPFFDPNSKQTLYYTTILDFPTGMYQPDIETSEGPQGNPTRRDYNWTTQMGLEPKFASAELWKSLSGGTGVTSLTGGSAGVGGTTIGRRVTDPSIFGTLGPITPTKR